MTLPVHRCSSTPISRLATTPAFLLFLLAPALCHAQHLGQVACSRPGDSIYFYSSMATLDIGGTLQCGQQVEVTGRYDNYFGVRTAKGEIGYVPLDSLLLLKTAPGAKVTLPAVTAPADVPASVPGSNPFLVLTDSTAVHVKIGKAISSVDARVDDDVNFEVSEDVIVDGLLVIPQGAVAVGVVNEAEPRKALGRGGKLSVLIRSVQLADHEQVVLRSGGEAKGSSSTAGMVIPVMHGKDVTFPKGTEFTGYVNGNIRLKRENFQLAPEVPDAPPSGTVTNVQHPKL